MSRTTTITLRQGERIFINGAVVKADRTVTMTFLNDVAYITERQIMQPEEATTSLRQLYFIVQTMVLDPAGVAAAADLFTGTMKWMLETHGSQEIRDGLVEIKDLIAANKPFDALGRVRRLIPVEDAILGFASQVELRLVEAV